MADSIKSTLYEDLLNITGGSHAMISDFLERLAAGSPEAIEAMAFVLENNGVHGGNPALRTARAALDRRHEGDSRGRGMMQHKQVVHIRCQENHCPICEGGLSLCEICGGAEGSMPTECPGVKMTHAQSDAVYAGTLDYRSGSWCKP